MSDSTVALAAGVALVAGAGWAVARAVWRRGEEPARSLRVVITGSSRGLGYALAREHLRLGDSVLVCGRSAEAVEQAKRGLAELVTSPSQRLASHVCDVSSPSGCDSLAREATSSLGGIDLWVNNAGVTQHPRQVLWATPAESVASIVGINLIGTMLGCRAALNVMIPQGHGCVFNMDGRGARGEGTPLSAVYGASKAAIPQLGKTLAKELPKGSGCSVHTASPGMVTTGLLMKGASPSTLKLFNILAETPETAAAWLVPRMRAAVDQPSGKYISYLTPAGVVWRFATAPWRKDRLFKVD
ncbi:MAG: hypothetical protein SGPRY_001664 [Prymnesium sp.]